MKKIFYSPTGTETRELTKEELEKFASDGDYEAKMELSKQVISKSLTTDEKINEVLKFLGLI